MTAGAVESPRTIGEFEELLESCFERLQQYRDIPHSVIDDECLIEVADLIQDAAGHATSFNCPERIPLRAMLTPLEGMRIVGSFLAGTRDEMRRQSPYLNIRQARRVRTESRGLPADTTKGRKTRACKLPRRMFAELKRIAGPEFVFEAFAEELRAIHRRRNRPQAARLIHALTPPRLVDWLQDQLALYFAKAEKPGSSCTTSGERP